MDRLGDEWTHLPDHLGLRVTRGPVPELLPGAEWPWSWIQVTPTAVLVDFGEGTRLLVEGGCEVTVQHDDDADPDGDPSWLLQGWAVTLAALQRGEISLHAATVEVAGAVVAVAGERGAGKSTTAVGLRTRGHRLLVDDVALIELRDDGAWITPYARNVHLLPDSAEALGIDFAALPPLALGRDKVAFRAEDPPIEPRRLELIVVLDPDPDATGVTATEARGTARVRALMDHTVRDGLAPLILGQATYFTRLARLANSARVVVLRRPAEGWSLDEVLDAIEREAVEASAEGTATAGRGPDADAAAGGVTDADATAGGATAGGVTDATATAGDPE